MDFRKLQSFREFADGGGFVVGHRFHDIHLMFIELRQVAIEVRVELHMGFARQFQRRRQGASHHLP